MEIETRSAAAPAGQNDLIVPMEAKEASKAERIGVHVRICLRLRFRDTLEGIIVKTAAAVPGIHDASMRTDHRIPLAGAAPLAIAAAGFDLIAEQHVSHLFAIIPL